MGRPHCEQDLIFLIGRHWDEITSETPLEDIEFYDGRSDGDGVDLDATGIFDGDEVIIEVEQEGSDFFEHGHGQNKCNLVICWDNDRTSEGLGSIESREWKTRSDDPDPAFEDIGIDVLELSELEVYWAN